MKKEELRNILIPNLSVLIKGNYVIYGIKEVSEVYYETLCSLYGKNCIAFFLDGSVHAPSEFHNRKVLRYTDLNSSEINHYLYILASITNSADEMKQNLLCQGVSPERIIDPVPYFKQSVLNGLLSQAKRIYCCDVFENTESLSEWINITQKYMNYDNVPITFFYYCKENVKEIYSDNIYVLEEFNGCCSETDILLVRSAANIPKIRESWKNPIICADDNFEIGITGKIFSTIGTRFNFSKKLYYEMQFKENFGRMQRKANERKAAVVFGNGPSLAEGVAKHEKWLKTTFNIVCNDMFQLKDIIEKIDPQCYVLSDEAFYRTEYREQLQNVINYVNDNDCTLCYPIHWTECLIEICGLDERKAIGFKYVLDKVLIPNSRNLSTCVGGNVILTMGLPIALAQEHDIFFIGCDGAVAKNTTDRTVWKYQKGINAVQYSDLFKERDFVGVSNTMTDDTIINMNAMYERLLNPALLKGKNFHTLTHSHFNILEQKMMLSLHETSDRR